MAAKSIPGKQWGNDKANANDTPDWRYVEEDPTHDGYAASGHNPNISLTGNATANVVATGKGWELNWPDSADGNPNAPVGNKEVLVAIGGLTMPALTALFLQDLSSNSDNVVSGNLAVRVQMSSGVDVRTANVANVYIVAIGDSGATPNVNLSYSVALSQPESGVLVFTAAVDLSGYSDGDTLTINASSGFNGSANVLSRKKKGPTQNVIATPFSTMTGANAVVITIL